MKKTEIDNAKALAKYHLEHQTGSEKLAQYVFQLASALSIARVDSKGRDVTHQPGLWSSEDVRLIRVQVPQELYEELAETAKRSKQSVEEVASLTLALGSRTRCESKSRG